MMAKQTLETTVTASQRVVTSLISICIMAGLTACGDEDASGVSGSARDDTAAYCPPDKKGNGIMVSSRFDIDDVLSAQKWRRDMFPKSCAGTLADLVPDLPDGYGIPPAARPYTMNSDQVYLAYAETKGVPDGADIQTGIPRDNDVLYFEISRYTPEEYAQLTQWMADNPGDYLDRSIDGQTLYLMGGVGIFFGQRKINVPRGLTALYDDSQIVIRMSHASLFNPIPDQPIGASAEALMRDILKRAEKAGI
jgi:hypothetical protein